VTIARLEVPDSAVTWTTTVAAVWFQGYVSQENACSEPATVFTSAGKNICMCFTLLLDKPPAWQSPFPSLSHNFPRLQGWVPQNPTTHSISL
jgi:hypothetical protein